MFKVITRNFSQEFERWTDALNQGNDLIPSCKSIFQDIRIFAGEELVWVYSRWHKYPQYIGAGNYRRLALLFMAEATAERDAADGITAEPEAPEAPGTQLDAVTRSTEKSTEQISHSSQPMADPWQD
jgi:hypothetical protein